MPARKSKKTVRSSAGQMIPYGDPIRGAIARGDVQEMRKLAAYTKKWVKDVESALSNLERKIKSVENK